MSPPPSSDKGGIEGRRGPGRARYPHPPKAQRPPNMSISHLSPNVKFSKKKKKGGARGGRVAPPRGSRGRGAPPPGVSLAGPPIPRMP